MTGPSYRNLFVSLVSLTVALLASSAIAAWSGPSSSPPNENVPAPVNVGSGDQIKDGGLGVGALSVYGSGYIQNSLGIGVESPTSPLHVSGAARADMFCLGSSCIDSWASAGGGGESVWSTNGSSIYYSGGNVGIGTASPSQALEVTGNLSVPFIYDRNNTSYYLDPSSTSYVHNINSSNVYFRSIGLWASSLRLSQQLGSTINYGSNSCPSGYLMVGIVSLDTWSSEVKCRQILY